MNQKQKLLTVKEASQKAGINQSILYTVMHHERLQFETIGGRKLINVDIFDNWVKKNIKQPLKKSKELDKKE
jgi:hypothetical protein